MTTFITWPFPVTGAPVSRTEADRLAEEIKVKEWGALGDNLSDDESAIQAAINHAIGPRTVNLPGGGTTTVTGGNVIFPPGTYKCLTTGNISVGSSDPNVRVNLIGCGQNATQVQANFSKGSNAYDNIGRVEGIVLWSVTLEGSLQSILDVNGSINAAQATCASLWNVSVNGDTGNAANAVPGPPFGSIGISLGNSCSAYDCRVQSQDIAYALSGTGCGLYGCSAETNRHGIRLGWSPNAGGPGVAGALTAYGFTINAFEAERCETTLDVYDVNGGLVTGMVCQGQISAMEGQSINNITWSAGTATVTTSANHNLPAGRQILQLDPGATVFQPNYGNQLCVIATYTPGTMAPNIFTYDLPVNPGAYPGGYVWLYPQYYNLRLRKVHNVAIIANAWNVNCAFASIDFEYPPTPNPGHAPAIGSPGEAEHSNNLLMDCNVLWGVQLPTTNPQNLAGWVFKGVYGVTNSFEGHAGWSGVNTVNQPDCHMRFADLPGHGAPYQLGPYEGQEYTITDSPTPASGNFGVAVTTGGGTNHVKLGRDNTGWKISG